MLSALNNQPTRRRLMGKTAFKGVLVVAALQVLLAALLATGCSDSSEKAPTEPGIELPVLPLITTHPRDTTVTEGGTATFTVIASEALTYTWVNELGDTLEGDTTATLTLTNIPLSADGTTYRCVVGNADGSVSSQFAILSVEAAPVSPTPSITGQPVSTYLIPGGSTILHVAATGPGLTYQWYRGNLDNPVINGQSQTLVVTRVPSMDVPDSYFCILGNAHGSLVTDTVTVRADAPRRFLLDTGSVLFAGHCAACHGAQGRGVAGETPPLAHADYLMQNRQRSIDITLAGTSDSMLVNGLWYQGTMPAMAESFSDVQIAAMLTYIRVVLNDSTVTSCNPNQLDGDGFPICQKSPRALQTITTDSVSYQEVLNTRAALFPL